MKEDINFASMGNGITVWDANRTRNGDYLTVAHIDYNRTVKYYKRISPGAKTRIENFARYENSHPVSQPEMPALCPINSAFMSTEEKDSYLRNHDCSADGIKRFISEIWDETKTPRENLTLFQQWWNNKVVNEYL
ncbi:MAG: hypothetical protein LUD40_12355 [Phocaeicola dorei]|nr:hypothetical protein [Phocaeicola dorei]